MERLREESENIGVEYTGGGSDPHQDWGQAIMLPLYTRVKKRQLRQSPDAYTAPAETFKRRLAFCLDTATLIVPAIIFVLSQPLGSASFAVRFTLYNGVVHEVNNIADRHRTRRNH